MCLAATAVRFYENWTFWSFAVAGLALFLSSLPYLRFVLYRGALSVELLDTLLLDEVLGNPSVRLPVILSNTGGRPLSVLAMKLSVAGTDGTVVLTLPARGLTKLGGRDGPTIFTRFRLRADEQWSHLVSFYQLWAWADEKKLKQLTKKGRKDLREKLRARADENKVAQLTKKGKKDLHEELEHGRKSAPQDDSLVELDLALIEEVVGFAKERARWDPGNYKLRLTVTCKPSKASVERSFSVTVFESDQQEFAERRARYKYGFGWLIDDPEFQAVEPRIRDLQ